MSSGRTRASPGISRAAAAQKSSAKPDEGHPSYVTWWSLRNRHIVDQVWCCLRTVRTWRLLSATISIKTRIPPTRMDCRLDTLLDTRLSSLRPPRALVTASASCCHVIASFSISLLPSTHTRTASSRAALALLCASLVDQRRIASALRTFSQRTATRREIGLFHISPPRLVTWINYPHSLVYASLYARFSISHDLYRYRPTLQTDNSIPRLAVS